MDRELAIKNGYGLAIAKQERAVAVEALVVEVDGMRFDADEVSQERMSRSIVALSEGESITWVLADNSIRQVTREQLRQALRKAGVAQTALWTVPYQE